MSGNSREMALMVSLALRKLKLTQYVFSGGGIMATLTQTMVPVMKAKRPDTAGKQIRHIPRGASDEKLSPMP